MRRYILIALAQLFFANCSFTLELAHVNPAYLLGLHPQMQSYHFGMGAFFRENLGSYERQQKLDLLVLHLGEIYKSFSIEDQKRRMEWTERASELSKSIQKASAASEVGRRGHVALKSIEAEYGKSYQQRVQNRDQEVLDLLQEVFLTPEESARKFRMIRLEIQKEMEVIRRSSGYDLLIAKIPFPEVKTKSWELRDLESLSYRLVSESANFLIGFYQGQPGWQNIQRMHNESEQLTILKNRVSVEEMKKHLARFSPDDPGIGFSGKSQDITLNVLSKVLKKHKYDPQKFLVVLRDLP